MKILVQRLDPEIPLPRHAHPGDGGVDLHAAAAARIEPGERVLVPAGIGVAIPAGYAGLVTPRSGLAWNHGVTVVNGPGLVDSGYRGELKVTLINSGAEPYQVEYGERIAQLVVVPVVTQQLVEVEVLPASTRGESGYGSTGTH
jgi:dUTP pyrophosphatase